MRTHEQAAERFVSEAGARLKKRLLERNTRLHDLGNEVYAVRYYDTDVVVYHPDGRIVVQTGGYKTLSTRERISGYSPCQIWQEKGTWHFQYKDKHYLFTESVYTLHPDGSVTPGTGKGERVPEFDPEAEKAAVKFRRKVGRYAKKFIDKLYDGDLSGDTGGDCLECKGLFGDRPATDSKENHVRSHIDENYFVVTLLLNALEWRSSPVMKWDTMALLQWPDGDEYADHRAHAEKHPLFGGFVRDELVKMLRRFCLKEMGMPH